MDMQELSERISKLEVKIDNLEEDNKEIKELKQMMYDNIVTSKEVTLEVKNLVSRLDKLENKVTDVVSEDGNKFNKYKDSIIVAAIGIIVAFLLKQIGIF